MLIVAGVGPGNPKYLTREVYEHILNEPKVVAFGRVNETLNGLRSDMIGVKKVSEIIEYVEKYKDLLILASGDPLFYGITAYLKTKGYEPDKICPGISSFQYLAAKCGIPWQSAKFFSLHGRNFDLSELKDSPLSVGLVDKSNPPSKISRELFQIGLRGKMIVGYNLSYEEERIEEIEIGRDCCDISELAVVVIINEVA